MDTTFHSIDIHIFDLHTTVRPLIAHDCIQEKLRFLVDPDGYRNQYINGQSILTDSFNIHPLSRNSQKNSFWKNYLSLLNESALDYWRLQAPFVCSVRQPTINLVTEGLRFQGKIRPFIYLSALGWSTNLDIHITGDIKLPELQDFILAILHKESIDNIGIENHEEPVIAHLELNQKPASLSDIFRSFSGKLLNEVYDLHNQPNDVIKISRYLIISLSKFDGPTLHYQRALGRKGMTDADQAMLHSLLRGEVIKAKELPRKVREQPHTLIEFDQRPDFLLIYFEYGTLVFMQKSASSKGRRQRSLSCFVANMRSCAFMIWTMFYFYKAARSTAESNEDVKNTRLMVLDNLKMMGEQFISAAAKTATNSIKYGSALFKHDGLQTLCSGSGDKTG